LQLLVYVPCLRAVKLHSSLTRQLLTGGRRVWPLDRFLRETAARGTMAVAESVEEPRVVPQLQALGIRYAQGFAVYRPQPLACFIEPHALLVA
jgi:EAL domain-containing protein (putative c-di-GMP-specific phosphodiesterase class I)